MCVSPIKVKGEMVVPDFWELWAQTNESTDHKQYFLDPCIEDGWEQSTTASIFKAHRHLCTSSASVWLAPSFYQMLCFVFFVGSGKKHWQ